MFPVSALPVHAHDTGTSYSDWRIQDSEVEVIVRLGLVDAARAARAPEVSGAPDPLGRYLAARLGVVAGDSRCEQSGQAERLPSTGGFERRRLRFHCPAGPPDRIQVRLLAESAPVHLHVARLTVNGTPRGERILFGEEHEWAFDGGAGNAPPRTAGIVSGLVRFVRLGVEHIARGPDHLAFLIAVALVAPRLSALLLMVSGFTAAHSLTLALAALGLVRPATVTVEALIGFSILLVAVEKLSLDASRSTWPIGLAALVPAGAALLAVLGRFAASALSCAGFALFTLAYAAALRGATRPERWRVGIAAAFGLVHGLGFAGGLALPRSSSVAAIVQAIFGFNLGVELGQLALLAAAWPALALLRRRASVALRLETAAAGFLAAAGGWWFVTRGMG